MSEVFDPSNTCLDERETIIIIRNKQARVYSCDAKWVNRLDKKYTATKEDKYGKWYEMPEDNIKIGPKRTVELTDEEKAAIVERLQNARKANTEVVELDGEA